MLQQHVTKYIKKNFAKGSQYVKEHAAAVAVSTSL